MTALPAAFVRTSVTFLCVGFVFGGWMLSAPGLGLPVPIGMRIVHIHFLMVGFFANMVMGVSIWMFPVPPGGGRAAVAEREPWGWSAYWLLLAGLLLRGVLEFVPLWGDVPALAGLMVVSAALQVVGAFCFAVAIWDRTQPRTFIKKTTAMPELRAGPDGKELDLSALPPVEWPSAAVQAWNVLKAGEALVVVANQSPRPIIRQLSVEQPDRPVAEMLSQGPPLWRVRFRKPEQSAGRDRGPD